MSVITFEDKRWKENPQKTEFRHRATVDLISNGTVLDIGCGDGLLLKLLREKGIQPTGVDISPEAIRRCKEAGFEASEHSLDNKLSYADNSFDTVTALDILEHVYDPLFVLKEAARASREYVIVSVPNFSSVPARLQVLRGQVPENNRPQKGHLYWFNEPVLRSMAEKAGLQPVEIKMNTFFPFSKLGTGAVSMWSNGLALSFVAKFKKK